MKKTLLALAIAGAFAGVAHAQSSLTVYGIIDVNVQRIDPDGPCSTAVPGSCITTGVNSGFKNGSRLGFRGLEDLGGGLAAFFTLEAGINVDNGTSAQGRLFGRGAFVGIRSKDFGEVALGRIPLFSAGTGAYDMTSAIDPWETGFGIAGMGSTISAASAVRPNNLALYRTPRISGVQGGVMYSFTGLADNEVAGGSAKNVRILGTGINYSAGPIYAAVTYDATYPISASKLPTQKNVIVGGVYDFGIAKLHAAYGRQTDESTTGTFANPAAPDSNAYMIGTTVPIGTGGSHVLASYQYHNGDKTTTATGSTLEQDRGVWAIGYVHALSRRTFVYAVYADSNGKKSLRNNPIFDRTETTIGINHRF